MAPRDGVTVEGGASTSPRVTRMDFSASSSAPVARLTLTTEFALGASRAPARNAPHENFPTEARWSPDGVCLLTSGAEDCVFRVYDVPARVPAPHDTRSSQEGNDAAKSRSSSRSSSESYVERSDVSDVSKHPPPDALWPALRVRAGESARDVAWLPTMCAHDTSTCLFASACKSQPVHLWSAVDGTVAASYGAKNRLDEPIDFTSLCFSRDGARVFAGAADAIRTWDLTRPGYHDVKAFWTGGKSKGRGSKRSKGRRRDEENGFVLNERAFDDDRRASTRSSSFRGAVSTMACAPLSGATARVVAAGAIGGGVALFHQDTGEMLMLFSDNNKEGSINKGDAQNAVTRVTWSPCGSFLYAARRRDAAVTCWDARMNSRSNGCVYSMPRVSGSTNQKIGFDLEPCGRHMVSGGTDGVLRAYDLRDGAEIAAWRAADATEAVSDFAFHPHASWGVPNDVNTPFAAVGASVSGHRRFKSRLAVEEENDAARDASFRAGTAGPTCALRVWQYDARALEEEEEAAA